MAVETILKQPAEVLRRQAHFIGLAAISAVVASVAARGLVPGAPLLTATPVLTDGIVAVDLAGGADGERYLVTVQATAADGEVGEAELDVAVIEGAWAMPDGGTGYLSVAEFVDRVGLPEVIARTDGVGDGRIDRAMLITVLTDAQAVVDTYFASRYLVPLSDPPLIVKKIITDLARAALYPSAVPDGVANAAAASQKLLERIQAGQVQIPLPSPPPPAVSEAPILIAPGRRAYPDGLEGYGRFR